MKKKRKDRKYLYLISRLKMLMFIKTTGLLLFIFLMPLASLANHQKSKVTLEMYEVTLDKVLLEIGKQTKMEFLYNYDVLNGIQLPKVQVNEKNFIQLLDELLPNYKLEYSLKDNVVIIKEKQSIAQEEVHIKGMVVDVKKVPLPGVTVMIKGTSLGTVTNVNGVFNLRLPEIELPIHLRFSFIGMESTELKYTGQDSIVVTLIESAETLNEVVVTGFGTLDKRLSTSAITSLKMDDIMMPGISTLDKMLESRVPGLVFMQNSGQVGATPRLRIRGSSTILGNQEPLWVVDDIIMDDPVNVDINKLNDLDFTNLLGNAISGLNPFDIERIDILKDASATALYGARAANGVIVISTKKGNVGPPRVSYNFNSTITRRPYYSDKGIHVMNSQERVELSREMIENGVKYSGDSQSELFAYEKAYVDHFKYGSISSEEFNRLSKFYQTVNTNWFKILMRNSFSQNHTIGLSGGSASARYNLSFSYTDEQGAIKKEYGKRYTAMINMTSQFKGTTINFKADGSKYNRRYTPEEVGVNNYAYNTSRAIPTHDINGEVMSYLKSNRYYNIFEDIENTDYTINQKRVGFNLSIRQKIFDWLNANITAGYNFSFSEDIEWFGENSFYVKFERGSNAAYNRIPYGGELRTRTNQNENYTLRGQLDFSKFLDNESSHLIFSSLGGEIRSSEYNNKSLIERNYMRDRGMTFADLGDYNNISKYEQFLIWQQSEGNTEYSTNLTNNVSGYWTFSYAYKNKYIFNVNGRVDFSNAFGDRSREKFNPIWSLSGKWDGKRDLFESIKAVNLFDIRVSYGTQGNMRNDQPTKLIITRGRYDASVEKYTSKVKYFPNPDLKWEKTHSVNASLDFAFFNRAISGTLSYFYKLTKDAFYDKPVSDINGITTYVVNKGNIENKGFEFSFNIEPINQKVDANGKRGFYWRFDPQISQTLNKLLKNGMQKEQHVKKDEYGINEYLEGRAVIPGVPLNTMMSYKFKSLDSNGQPTFYDLSADEAEEREALISKYRDMTMEERVLCFLEESGRRVPILQGGLYNVFGYRNFQLSLNFSYSFGNKVRLLKIASGHYTGVSPQISQNVRREFTERWRVPGDEEFKTIPGVLKNDNQKYFWFSSPNNWTEGQNIYEAYDNSNIRVVSGDYLRLQSLNFTYRIEQRLLNKIGVSDGFVSFSGSNLFTIAHKDLKGQNPEQSGTTSIIGLSIRPTYTLGINFSF